MNERKEYIILFLVGVIGVLAMLLSWVLLEKEKAEHENGVLRYERAEMVRWMEWEGKAPKIGGAESRVEAPEESGSEFIPPFHQEDLLRATSPYGRRISPKYNYPIKHNGVDLAGVWRARVVSIADGTVVEHWPPPDGYYTGHDVYGGMIKIEHKGDVESLYAHLATTYVHEGDRVRQGQVIARQGNTGVSEGSHLHFELRVEGELVNPLAYVEGVNDAVVRKAYTGLDKDNEHGADKGREVNARGEPASGIAEDTRASY